MTSLAPDHVSLVEMLVAGGESYYVEFKSAWSYGPEGRELRAAKDVAQDIGRTIVAFANADGGDLLVGVEDDGNVTGVALRDEQIRYLLGWQQQLADGGEGVAVRTSSVQWHGQQVLLFRVGASESQVITTKDGTCLMRQGAASVPVSPTRITQRREHVIGDRDYESAPVPEASIDDLDLQLIRRSELFESAADPLKLLRYWNLVEQRNGSVVLRRAALLLFAREPLRWHANNRVRVRRILGDEPEFGRNLRTREREIDGPVAGILQNASFVLHRELERESRQELLFDTSTLLPRDAVDECLVNAVVHRNYAIEGQAVEIHLYPDRVEFRSPGSLPDPITIADLRAERGVHRSRNPIMMRVLRDLGWTRDQGEGMRRIFGSMRQVELHEPELEEHADTFIVRLSTQSIYDAPTRAWIASYGPFGLQPEERRYLIALRQAGGQQSVDRLARSLDLSFDHTKDALARLERRHLVWHRPKSRTYHLVEPLNVPHERVVRLLERSGVDIGPATILDREQISAMTKTPDQRAISALIDSWKQAGILSPTGSKRWRLGQSLLAYFTQRSG